MQCEAIGKGILQQPNPLPNIMLPVAEEAHKINSVPSRILMEIFHEATALAEDPGNIVPLPGNKDGKIYMATNKDKPTDPFMVKFAPSSVAITCEKKCPRWGGFHICEHCIAVASFLGILKSYLVKYQKQEVKKGQTCNLTELANTNMPANRGKKGNSATQRRKGKMSKTSKDILHYSETSRPTNLKDTTNDVSKQTTGQPFHLTFIAGLIKKCYGCGQPFQNRHRCPPNDIILKRFDYRTYISPVSKVEKHTQTLQNTYYHLNKDCVRRLCPTFEMKNILIHDEIAEQLSEAHKNIIRKTGLDI